MKTLFTGLLFLFQISLFAQHPWGQKASLPITDGIQGCFSFSMNGKLYVGGGYDNIAGNVVNGFYEYDPSTNTWTVKASVPQAVGTNDGFELNGFGYIACGIVSGLAPSNFVYKYDTATNSWTQLHNFTGSNRQNHKCFTLNGYGYMFAGFDGFNTLNEMWEYNPTTDSWVQKASPPLPAVGPGRNGPAVLVINNQAYVGLGGTANGSNAFSDFYLFDPGTIGVAGSGSYTPVAPMPVGRECGAMFAIGDTGYIGIGYKGGTGYLDDFWKYDPVANVWTQLCNFNGGARQHPFSAAVNGVPYVGCGDNASGNNKDNWTWTTCTLNVNLGNDTAICSGETVTLKDTFLHASSLWSTGDTTPSITVSAGGSYWLQVTQQNCSICIGRDTINVSIQGTPPAFSLGADTTYCGSFSRVLSTGNANTLWSTGATGSFITVTNPGIYWAKVSNNCSSISDTIVIHQNPIPMVNLGNDTSLCQGNNVILNAGNPGAAYQWQNNTTSQTLTVTSSGTYWVNVTVNGCRKLDSIIVSYVAPLPPFSIGNDTAYCGSFATTLSTGINTTLWSTGTTASSILVTNPGLYWAQETNICGIRRDSVDITEKPIPTVNLGNDTSLCQGNEVILNAGNPGATYQWQNNTTGQTLTVSSPGTYWADVTVNGCSKQDSIIITYVAPLLPFGIGNDTTYCGPFTRTLATGVNTTLWSTGATASSITVAHSGLYWAQETNICGSLRDSIDLSQKPLPIVNLGSDTSVCPGHAVILNAGNPGGIYQWQNNTTGQTLASDSPGLYWVDVTINGCTKRDTILISDLSPPLPFRIGNDTTICQDSSITLNAYQFNTSYYWSNGDTTPFIVVVRSGSYQVIDSNACGSYTASVTVTTRECSCKLDIPTAFSPNNDGRNDFYHVLTQCPLRNFQFEIYDRWGQKLFSTNNIMDKWDGTYRGLPQPLGVYVYYLKYTDPYTNMEHCQSGNVTLVR